MMRYVSAISLLLLTTGCVVGIDPPVPTERVLVSGGVFPFGSEIPCFDANDSRELTCDDTLTGLPKTYPIVKVNLDPFMVDVHEVTNAQYRYCVEMGNCSLPDWANSYSTENYWDNPMYDDYPVVNVPKPSAQAYCEFMGGRLPTEIEWERVAGGLPDPPLTSKRLYPADGLTWSKIKACPTSYRDINISYCTNKKDPAEVMSSADDYVMEGDKKIYDLAGNVSEWVSGGFVDGVTCEYDLPVDCDCWKCEADDKKCKEECYTQCDECQSNQKCYVMCEDEFGALGLPVCIAYSGLVDAITIYDKGKNGPDLAKGGHYLIEAATTCQMAVAARSRTFDKGGSAPSIGFRCVADVN